MSYNSSIPNVTDFLALSQKQILANYNAIYNAFAQNHVTLNSTKFNPGQHNSLTLRPQMVDPATGSTEVAIYNKLVTGTPQLFYRPHNSATPIQMTNSNYSSLTVPGVEIRVSTFLAGPFTIYMGLFLNITNPTTVTLTPSSTLIYVGLTASYPGGIPPFIELNPIPTNISGNQFTVSGMTGLPFFPILYYVAIGK